jgi:hypothetical protein
MVFRSGASLTRGKFSFRKSAKACWEKRTFALMPTISVSADSNFE